MLEIGATVTGLGWGRTISLAPLTFERMGHHNCPLLALRPGPRYRFTVVAEALRGGAERLVGVMAWVPQACTLPTSEQQLRVAEFDELFASAVRPAVRRAPAWLQLYLADGGEVTATVQSLIARETACCSFFTFMLRPSAEALELNVRVPESHVAVLDAVQLRAETARADAAPAS